MLEFATEVAVLISLFTVGLTLRVPVGDRMWRLPVKLAVNSMLVTVALLAGAAVFFLGFSTATALVLAAILAPTDPVLASEVQLREPGDRDRLRFSLSGEGGLNDGMAFPLVLLGLGLLGAHDLGQFGSRWLLLDVVWASLAGLGSGWLCGLLIGKLVVYLRQAYREALGMEEFLVLGSIALAYGIAHLCAGNGFLAVFAAGLALRRIEHLNSGASAPAAVSVSPQAAAASAAASAPDTAPAYMAHALLGFNKQLERIAEFAVVLCVGGMLSALAWSTRAMALALLLFLVIRPAATLIGTLGSRMSKAQRRLICWFGIRGVGSIYYLAYAIGHGLSRAVAEQFATLVLGVVAASVVLHGVSATPLMQWYKTRQGASS